MKQILASTQRRLKETADMDETKMAVYEFCKLRQWLINNAFNVTNISFSEQLNGWYFLLPMEGSKKIPKVVRELVNAIASSFDWKLGSTDAGLKFVGKYVSVSLNLRHYPTFILENVGRDIKVQTPSYWL